MSIGDRIRILRKKENLNQNEFGARIALASNTITNYETGRRNPSNQVIELICREFNINEIWLRTGEGEMVMDLSREDELAAWAGTLLSNSSNNTFQKKFVHVLSKLSIEDWKVLERIAILMLQEK